MKKNLVKKGMLILTAAVFAFGMTACGSSSGGSSDSGSSSDGYVFETDGVTIAMNAEAADIVEALGDYKDYFESESCAFDGLDKQYTYSGFVLTTYPTDDVDYVAGVEFVDDTVETPEGITIGSTLDEVTEAYGESDSETSCEYESGDSQLLILLEDGVVTSVQYTAITE